MTQPIPPTDTEHAIPGIVPIRDMYQSWFLDYASYVILERAVPAIEDGLKPVQRRILHAMREMDDGRYNKVANIIGQTMQYHPHGDASIGEALIHLGQKDLLIDMQGNWGDMRTGDGAAAPRYIEARPAKFSLEVLYNPATTAWQLSYDGRKKEPITLPVKFPLLLAQGVEGIAVGLSTKILPHNFCELLHASIDVLRGKKVQLLPDFPTGGAVDCSAYNEGQRGGKVRIRATIEPLDKKTLVIKDLPYGTTTTNLIDSIIKANDKGKIKIKKVLDNTAQDVEIIVQLASGQSPSITIDALYAFTDCEVSVSPNACVILDEKPVFLSVNTLLEHSTLRTKDLLQKELEIQQSKLREQILFASLEQLFIEQRIYRQIEVCETWEAVLATIDQGLTPYKKDFYRPIAEEDLVRLTEIKIKRISKYDTAHAQEKLRSLQEELSQVQHDLNHLTEYVIQYFKKLLKQYGKGRERKTELRNFDTIAAHAVAANNQKLYVNRKEGFIGYGMKKDELLGECSDLDEVIVFRKDGKCLVTKVAEKVFVGKGIIHAAVFKKNDDRRVYNMIYVDGDTGRTMVKRFQMLSITRDKAYDLTKGTPKSRVLYLTDNPNGEAEAITVVLSDLSKARHKVFDFDFATLDIKGRAAQGNILTKHTVRKIRLKTPGQSTLGAEDIWYDSAVGRLNKEGRGTLLGSFQAQDLMLVVFQDGHYILTRCDLNHRFDPEQVVLLERWVAEHPLSIVYYDGKAKQYFAKRFCIETTTLDKKFDFMTATKGTRLVLATTDVHSQLSITYRTSAQAATQMLRYDLEALAVKGCKAQGSRLAKHTVTKVTLLEPANKMVKEA
ncbi:MAG: DNA gyrase/topoisomerase IV subunit A [Bacteroidota bacterium]